MTASNREAAISKTLTYEGGYTNHPRDPGGPTNWGITIYDARLYWKKDATAADVKAMPKSVAIDIYRSKYWAKMGCDERPDGVDLVEFDFGVNSGVSRALKYRAAMPALEPIKYVKEYCKRRLSFLRGLGTFKVFGKGWTRRVVDVEATGVAMAAKAVNRPVKAVLEKEAKKASGKSAAQSMGATGAAASPIPLLDSSALHNADPSAIAGLVFIVVVAFTLGSFLIYRSYINNQRGAAYKAAAASA